MTVCILKARPRASLRPRQQPKCNLLFIAVWDNEGSSQKIGEGSHSFFLPLSVSFSLSLPLTWIDGKHLKWTFYLYLPFIFSSKTVELLPSCAVDFFMWITSEKIEERQANFIQWKPSVILCLFPKCSSSRCLAIS